MDIDTLIKGLSENDNVVKMSEQIGVDHDRLAKWIAVSVKDFPNENIVPIVGLTLGVLQSQCNDI
jgi:hypothetical protein